MNCRVCNSEEFRTIRLDNSSVEHFNPNRTYFSGTADLDFCVDCGTIRVDESTRRQAANEPRRSDRFASLNESRIPASAGCHQFFHHRSKNTEP